MPTFSYAMAGAIRRTIATQAPRNLEHFLIARRLVEAGARCVTLNFGRWDFHSNNFSEFRNTHAPLFDQGMSALVGDLHERGLDKDVSSSISAASCRGSLSMRIIGLLANH